MKTIKKKKREKGFTLIELLATIAILTLLMSIVAYISINVIDNSKEKSNKVTQETIRRTANMYALEFKQSSDYWYPIENTENEYACTTIQMLINKGYLKNNLEDAQTGNSIKPDTFVKITRNKITKRNETVELLGENNNDCKNIQDVNITIEFEGEKGEQDFYTEEVIAKLKFEPEENVEKFYYYLVNNGNKGDVQEREELASEEDYSHKYNINQQSNSLKFCTYVENKNGKVDKEHTCRDLKIDYAAPINHTVEYSEDGTKLIFSGATDPLNITKDSEIRYFYEDLITNETKQSKEYLLPTDRNSSIKFYTKDNAGNISEKIQVGTRYSTPFDGEVSKKYYCDLTGTYYSSQIDAADACVKEVQYTGDLKYYCNKTGTYQTTAICKQTEVQSTLATAKYYCNDGAYQTNSTCKNIYNGKLMYRCDDGTYQTDKTCKKTSSYTGTTVKVCPDGSTTTSSVCSASGFTTTQNFTATCKKLSNYSWVLTDDEVTSSCTVKYPMDCYESIVGVSRVTCVASHLNCSEGNLSGNTCGITANTTTKCQSYSNNGWSCTTNSLGGCNCTKQATTYYFKSTYTCTKTPAAKGTYEDPICTSNCESNKTCPSGYTKNATLTSNTCSGVSGTTCTSDGTCSKMYTATCTAEPATKYSCDGQIQDSSSCTSTTTYDGEEVYYYAHDDSYRTTSTYTESYTGTKKYTCDGGKTYQTESTCESVVNSNYNGTPKYECDGIYQDSETCTKLEEQEVNKKYYCSLTDKYYTTESEATTACSNSCEKGGTYINGKCYYLDIGN